MPPSPTPSAARPAAQRPPRVPERPGRSVLPPACGCLCLVLALESAAAAVPSEVQVEDIRVGGRQTEAPVDVKILLPESATPEQRPLKVKDYLLLGAELIVPSRTVIGLQSPPGTRVALTPGSRFRVNSPRMVEVRGGKARFNVTKLFDFFSVEYEGFAALVRGTTFSVEVEPGRQVVCELSEGHLRVERSGRVRIVEGSRTAEVAELVDLDPRRNPRLVVSLKQDEYLREFGTFAEAESYYRERLREAERSGSFDALQGARNGLGSILVTIGRPREAAPIFAEAAAAAASRRDLPWQARMLNNLGAARLAARDFQGAIAATEEALAVNRELYPDGISKRIAHNENNLGLAWRGLGDLPRAIEFFEKALAVNRALTPDGRSRAIAGNYGNLGNTLLQAGEAERGLDYLQKALELLRSLYPDGRHPDLGNAYADLGAARLAAGDLPGALRYQRQALSVRQGLFPGQDHPAVADSLAAYGRTLTLAGLWNSGLRFQDEALAMRRRLAAEAAELQSLRDLAASWRERGDPARAAEFYRAADALAARLPAAP